MKTIKNKPGKSLVEGELHSADLWAKSSSDPSGIGVQRTRAQKPGTITVAEQTQSIRNWCGAKAQLQSLGRNSLNYLQHCLHVGVWPLAHHPRGQQLAVRRDSGPRTMPHRLHLWRCWSGAHRFSTPVQSWEQPGRVLSSLKSGQLQNTGLKPKKQTKKPQPKYN